MEKTTTYTWYVSYYKRRNLISNKRVEAVTAEQAIKRARVKDIIDLYPIDNTGNRIEVQKD